MKNRKQWSVACLMTLLAAAGCLSARELRDEGDGEPGDGTGEPGDGDGDADPNPPDSSAPACIDRGRYDLDGVTVQGLAHTCNGDDVCVEGRCVAEPMCAPGLKSACKLGFSATRGRRSNVASVGPYLYWFETGSDDGLGNYQYDGALARTKPGEWVREEVMSGLDFSSESLNPREPLGIEVRGNSIYATTGWFLENAAARFDLDTGEASTESQELPLCGSEDGARVYIDYVSSRNNVMRLREPSGAERTHTLWGATACHITSEAVWYAAPNDKLVRFERATGIATTLAPLFRLIAVDEEQVYQVQEKRLAVATPGDTASLFWQSVLRVTLSRQIESDYGVPGFDSVFAVRRGVATWSRIGDRRTNTVVLQSPLSSTELPRVRAEIMLSDYARMRLGSGKVLVSLGESWAAYVELGDQGMLVGDTHVVPFAD